MPVVQSDSEKSLSDDVTKVFTVKEIQPDHKTPSSPPPDLKLTYMYHKSELRHFDCVDLTVVETLMWYIWNAQI